MTHIARTHPEWVGVTLEEAKVLVAAGRSAQRSDILEEDEWRGVRREAIATAALQGILASSGSGLAPKVYVERAVALADALMAELAKPKEKPGA